MIRPMMQTAVILAAFAAAAAKDTQCYWKSFAGATYDLRGMTIGSKDKCYHIKAGDIECTPEEEPSYNYIFNLCAPTPSQCIPDACKSKEASAVMQYLDKDCWIAGTYDTQHDDSHYALLDANDPSVGVSMTYRSGEACKTGNVQRTTTFDVYCDDVSPPYIEDATEPTHCQYHVILKSVHGCPKECAVTSNGLCNGHGKCMYDSSRKEAYCYCNKGYGGNSCTKASGGSDDEYDGYSVQLALTIVLLIVTLALLAVVGFFIYKLYGYRQETQYVSLGDNEMTTHDTF